MPILDDLAAKYNSLDPSARGAIVGGLSAGTVGAGISALREKDPNETGMGRLGRILRNGMVTGALGAGAGALFPKAQEWISNARPSGDKDPVAATLGGPTATALAGGTGLAWGLRRGKEAITDEVKGIDQLRDRMVKGLSEPASAAASRFHPVQVDVQNAVRAAMQEASKGKAAGNPNAIENALQQIFDPRAQTPATRGWTDAGRQVLGESTQGALTPHLDTALRRLGVSPESGTLARAFGKLRNAGSRRFGFVNPLNLMEGAHPGVKATGKVALGVGAALTIQQLLAKYLGEKSASSSIGQDLALLSTASKRSTPSAG